MSPSSRPRFVPVWFLALIGAFAVAGGFQPKPSSALPPSPAGEARPSGPALTVPGTPDFTDVAPRRFLGTIGSNILVVEIDGKDTTVRLVGVDATAGFDSRVSGPEASIAGSDFLGDLLEGESVYLIDYEGKTSADPSGARYVYAYRAPDGLFINQEIVRRGYARADTYIQYRHLQAFRDWDQRAKEAKRGLWGDRRLPEPAQAPAAPVPPQPGTPLATPPAPSALAPTPSTPPAADKRDSQSVTVYGTRTGSKYHTGGCQYLSKIAIPMTLKEAKAKGLTPCSRCHPPLSAVDPAQPETIPTARIPSSRPLSTGGTVPVRGYYRKDGTYVRPHTRRSPGR